MNAANNMMPQAPAFRGPVMQPWSRQMPLIAQPDPNRPAPHATPGQEATEAGVQAKAQQVGAPIPGKQAVEEELSAGIVRAKCALMQLGGWFGSESNLAKSSGQDNSMPQRSAVGESGLWFEDAGPEVYGLDAWNSLDKWLRSTAKGDADPFRGQHQPKPKQGKFHVPEIRQTRN